MSADDDKVKDKDSAAEDKVRDKDSADDDDDKDKDSPEKSKKPAKSQVFRVSFADESNRLSKTKRLVKKWMMATLKRIQSSSGDPSELKDVEKEMVAEVLALLQDGQVDAEPLVAQIQALVNSAPKILVDLGVRVEWQTLMESFKTDLGAVLENPKVSDLVNDIKTETMTILSDPKISNLGAQFLQEVMWLVLTPPAAANEMEQCINTVMKLFQKIAETIDEMDQEEEGGKPL